MIRVAIVGFGNIGRFALEAIQASDDMVCVGIVRREAKPIAELPPDIAITTDVKSLGHVDVALLCVPSRSVPHYAAEYLRLGICTVDSFDIHQDILSLKNQLQPLAVQYNKTAIIAAGWDPGSDSVFRAIMLAMAPRGITHTNFGPGMSMGHSVAAKAISGVKDALSLTIPLGTGIHRRMVYVELKAGADFQTISHAIKQDDYFKNDETHVFAVESVEALKDMGHGVCIQHKGVSGSSHNQQFTFDMRINNPALTAQIMVSSARAALRQQSGAYTLIEIAPVDFLSGDKTQWISKLV